VTPVWDREPGEPGAGFEEIAAKRSATARRAA
jgi:hypothetical protein